MAGAPSPPPPFFGAKHRAFVLSLEAQRGERLEFVVSEHLRLSALYWGLSALETLSSGHLLDKAAIVREVQQCRAPDGGYSGAPGHDSHLLHTLSALQLLALCGSGGGSGSGDGGEGEGEGGSMRSA
jgi:geranylgeranyl transferase type-2 subunit beta